MTFETIEGGAGVPSEPVWAMIFDDPEQAVVAASYWRTIVDEMRAANTLTVANGHSMRRLVLAWMSYDQCALTVASGGPIRIVKGHARKHPAWMVMRQAAEMADRIEAELGLSPHRRGRVGKVHRVKKAPRAADKYLRPVED